MVLRKLLGKLWNRLVKRHELTVPGHYAQVQRVCQFVADGARRAGFGEDELFRIELCCDEAATNIIEHAYGGEGIGSITVSYQDKGDRFEIVLRDNGRSFDPTTVPAPPDLTTLPADPQALPVGGFGLHLIKQLMDEVQFTFDPRKGNRLKMMKQKGTP
ncbi:MAG: ATP-binding protein [Anaerolineales bacterium]|nr:ATP-binding protein [Anaerolineales bacterium]